MFLFARVNGDGNTISVGRYQLLGLTLQELSLWELSLKLMVAREYRRAS